MSRRNRLISGERAVVCDLSQVTAVPWRLPTLMHAGVGRVIVPEKEHSERRRNLDITDHVLDSVSGEIREETVHPVLWDERQGMTLRRRQPRHLAGETDAA